VSVPPPPIYWSPDVDEGLVAGRTGELVGEVRADNRLDARDEPEPGRGREGHRHPDPDIVIVDRVEAGTAGEAGGRGCSEDRVVAAGADDVGDAAIGVAGGEAAGGERACRVGEIDEDGRPACRVRGVVDRVEAAAADIDVARRAALVDEGLVAGGAGEAVGELRADDRLDLRDDDDAGGRDVRQGGRHHEADAGRRLGVVERVDACPADEAIARIGRVDIVVAGGALEALDIDHLVAGRVASRDHEAAGLEA
jgi:hypothetical protein